jgi:hypothetical protein
MEGFELEKWICTKAFGLTFSIRMLLTAELTLEDQLRAIMSNIHRWSEAMEAQGFHLLRKEELKDGLYYYGHCRNASVAKWNAEKQLFTYMRTKFCDRFPEDIDPYFIDNGYDQFYPYYETTPTKEQEIT